MVCNNTHSHDTHKEHFVRTSLKKKNFSRDSLPADASFRKYERISFPNKSFILMDASADKESIAPFIILSEFLQKHGFSAPKILAKEVDKGFLLLEDFGDKSYSSLLASNDPNIKEIEYKLYKHAIDLLIDLHNKVSLNSINAPSYHTDSLLDEAILLLDWYFPALNNTKISDQLRQEYIDTWKKIFNCINYKEHCLVLRDYHVDNLMWLENRKDIKKIGVLDFQDAVKGSYAYDIVSLLEDARRNIGDTLVNDMINYYIKKMDKLDRKKFLSDYTILGVQRSCKIIGIFTRKAIRDKDSKYLKHLPRVWSYIKKNIHHPILEPLKVWFNKVDIPVIKGKI